MKEAKVLDAGNIGKVFRAARFAAKKKPATVYRETGVAITHLKLIEQGDISPRIDTVAALAKCYGCQLYLTPAE